MLMSQYVYTGLEQKRKEIMWSKNIQPIVLLYETYHNYSWGLKVSLLRDLQEQLCGLDQFLHCSNSLLPCSQAFIYKYTRTCAELHKQQVQESSLLQTHYTVHLHTFNESNTSRNVSLFCAESLHWLVNMTEVRNHKTIKLI